MFHIRDYLNPSDPFVQAHSLETPKQCYLFKHRIAQLLQPRRILVSDSWWGRARMKSR